MTSSCLLITPPWTSSALQRRKYPRRSQFPIVSLQKHFSFFRIYCFRRRRDESQPWREELRSGERDEL